MSTEYKCLNRRCGQIQTIDEIYDEEYGNLCCSYCLGHDFFEREIIEPISVMPVELQAIKVLSRMQEEA